MKYIQQSSDICTVLSDSEYSFKKEAIEMEICEGCQTPGSSPGQLRVCSGCVQVSYCSQTCQKKHWKQHKSKCRPFKLIPFPGKGLGLVATKLIKKSDVFIKENPVLVKLNDKNCMSLLGQFNQQNEETREIILNLYHDNPTDELQNRLEGVFRANACDIRHGCGVGLYPTIPRMNHSCCPNVVWSYKASSPLTKEVRALRDIEPGEELCPNYIDSFEVSSSSC